jgi:hypothetical protein
VKEDGGQAKYRREGKTNRKDGEDGEGCFVVGGFREKGGFFYGSLVINGIDKKKGIYLVDVHSDYQFYIIIYINS